LNVTNAKTRKLIIVAFVAVPLLCCGGGLYMLSRKVDYLQESASLEAVIEQARRAGLPMTKEEVELREVADEKNADFVFKSLLKEKPKGITDQEIDKLFRTPTSNQNRLSQFDVYIDQLDQRPELKMNKDWDIGSYVLFPELAVAKRLTRVMCLQAVVEARRGNAAFVKKRLDTMHRLSDEYRQTSVIIPYLVGIAIRSIADGAAIHCVVASGGDPRVVEVARTALKNKRADVDYRTPLRGEYYMGLALMRNLHSVQRPDKEDRDEDAPPAWTKNPIRSGLPKGIQARGSLAAYTRHMIAIDAIVAKHSASPDVTQRLERYEENIPSTASNLISSILVPVYGQAIESDKKSLVRNQIALKAIDLYLWIKANGKVPVTLSQAGIEATDTISGRSLKIGFREKQVTIYSVGANKKDEGGPASKGRRSDDFGFSFDVMSAR
jgi:hypothetical protein